MNELRSKYLDMLSWFDNYYTKQEQKLRRLHTLNKLTDDGLDPLQELIKLYNDAEDKRKQIQALEAQIKALEA